MSDISRQKRQHSQVLGQHYNEDNPKSKTRRVRMYRGGGIGIARAAAYPHCRLLRRQVTALAVGVALDRAPISRAPTRELSPNAPSYPRARRELSTVLVTGG